MLGEILRLMRLRGSVEEQREMVRILDSSPPPYGLPRRCSNRVTRHVASTPKVRVKQPKQLCAGRT